jgi:competence protein ComEC
MRFLKQNLLLAILALFTLYQLFSIPKTEYKDGDFVRINSKVLNEPRRYETIQGLKLEGMWLYLPSYPEISYGDRIVVEGKVDGEELQDPVLLGVKEATGPLFRVRKKLLAIYQRTLPSPHNSLVSGFVLGSKATIPKDFWEDLKHTGTAHVVVASGMNVSLVAKFLIIFLTTFLLRRRAIILSLTGIWFYALLAGFDAPIIRAAVMGSISFVAEALGRVSSAWRGLFLAALVMLIINPIWITNLGFILSFVATGSLMIFEAPIRSKLGKLPHIFKEGLSTSLAAQIGVAPILFVTFGYFNIWSPVINSLVLWTVAPVTVISATGGVLALLIQPLGQLILWLAFPMTWWFVFMVELFC